MITVKIKYRTGEFHTYQMSLLSEALAKVKDELSVGDRYIMKDENNVLLATGYITDYIDSKYK